MPGDTSFVHAGDGFAYQHDAIAEPIVLSTTFRRAPDGTHPYGFEYAREGNPNREDFERRMAHVEGGVEAAAFASGMAAAMVLFQTLTPTDHAVVSEDTYFGVRHALTGYFGSRGIDVSFADATEPSSVAEHVRANTRIIFVESPSNPLLRVCDISKIADVAYAVSAMLVCDNTLATPVFQQPLQLGADFVVHSTTKYVSGHHDAQGGVVVAREASERWRAVRQLQKLFGAVPSPFACWLSSRGLPTLPCRLRRQSQTALPGRTTSTTRRCARSFSSRSAF